MPLYNVTVDDSSPILQYSDGWTAAAKQDPRFLNSTDHATKIESANVTLTFNGTAIWLGGPLGSNHGDYSVTLDGESVQDNSFATQETYQQVLFSKTDLENTEHTVVLSNLPQNSSRSFVGLDFVTFTTGNEDASMQVVESTIDDTDPSVVYSGWSTTANQFLPQYHNSTFHVTNSLGATLQIPFTGSAIAVYGAIAPDHRSFSVYLDGTGPVSANGSYPVFQAQTLLFYASNLANSSHVVTLVNTDANNSAVLDFDFAVISHYITSFDSAPGDPTGGPSASSVPKQHSAHSHVGAIAGGIIGGLAVMALIAALVFYRRNRSAASSSMADNTQQQHPFMRSLSPSAITPTSQSHLPSAPPSDWASSRPSYESSPNVSSARARKSPLNFMSNQHMGSPLTFSSITSEGNEDSISRVSASASEPLPQIQSPPRGSRARKGDNISPSRQSPGFSLGYRDGGPVPGQVERDDFPPPNYTDVFNSERSSSGATGL